MTTEKERKEIAEKILLRSVNGKEIRIGRFLGTKVPDKYKNLKVLFDSQKILGALYISETEKVIQVVDVGVFQIVETNDKTKG